MNFWKNLQINSIQTNKIFGVISRNELIKNHNKIPKKDLVLISILQPGIESFDLDIIGDFKKFRTFKFFDITQDDEENTTLKVISDEIAKEIKNFILENKDERFLIHCMAGQSRSAGVARAIECLTLFDGNVYDYKTCFTSEIEKNPRYTANLTVFDKIVNI